VMWDLFGIARFIARIIQDENHEIETDSTASDTDESNVDDEEAENIRTVRALLEFEAKSLELNLGGHDDLEQPATAVAIGNLKKYCEERFSEVNSRNISGMLYPDRR
jgi:hypothetical protein